MESSPAQIPFPFNKSTADITAPVMLYFSWKEDSAGFLPSPQS